MSHRLDDNRPIYLQIKELIEDSIINGTIQVNERVPSTNELAKFYKINPATARQGVNELVVEGILEKRRGIGMFLSEEGRTILMEKRKQTFYETYIVPLKTEAQMLRITNDQLLEMIRNGDDTNEN